MELAKSEPEISFLSFESNHLKREHGARVKGIDIFTEWLRISNPELLQTITNTKENLLLWVKKPSHILHRFYNAAERAGIRIRNIARIYGLKGVFRHVFIGYKIITHRIIITKQKRIQMETRTSQAPEPSRNLKALQIVEAWLEHHEIMKKIGIEER